MTQNIENMVENYVEIRDSVINTREYGLDFSSTSSAWLFNYVQQLHPYRVELKVSDIFEITSTIKTIRMTPVNGYLPPFQAGQYIEVFANIDGVYTGRPYSISSSPSQRA